MPSNALELSQIKLTRKPSAYLGRRPQKEEKMELDLLSIGEVMAETHKDQSGIFSLGFAADTCNTVVYFTRALNTAGGVACWTLIGNDLI